MSNLFIPKKIRVGFQNRTDTFTGKLAYVIYYDEKGNIRKEKSWNGWCDSKIKSLELDNSPRNNYVFNKGVKRDGHWGSGRSVIRVYDPRDFEFEISVDNLIGLLMHSDVSKRDIVEECVFAWSGSELVLLPVNSEEYTKSVQYTDKQSKSVSTKDLVKGCVYSQKKQPDQLIYLGFFQFLEHERYSNRQKDKGKRHVFYNAAADERWASKFVIPSVSTLAECVLSEPVENYAELVDKFIASKHYKKFVDIKFVSEEPKKDDRYSYAHWYKQLNPNEFVKLYASMYHNKDSVKMDQIYVTYYTVDRASGIVKIEENSSKYPREGYHSYYRMNHSAPEAKELSTIFDAVPSKELNQKNFSKKLIELGYGSAYLINESGKKVRYQN